VRRSFGDIDATRAGLIGQLSVFST